MYVGSRRSRVAGVAIAAGLCALSAATAPVWADDLGSTATNTASSSPTASAQTQPTAATSASGATASTTPSRAVADLDLARAAIAKKDWAGALVILKRAAATDPKNADVQNLLGFASRNSGDTKAALTYYAKALQLDPKHRGALEYRGETYVKLGQIAKAKADLATLKKVCGVGCEQYVDLAKAIAAAPKR